MRVSIKKAVVLILTTAFEMLKKNLVKLCLYGWFRSMAVPLQTDMIYFCSLNLHVFSEEKMWQFDVM